MINPAAQSPPHKSMTLLSRLLLVPQDGDNAASSMVAGLQSELRNLSREEFDDLLTLANLNHVVVRGLEAFLNMMREAKDATRVEWAQIALAAERARITTALTILHDICTAFEFEEYDVAVIKSLDHWPDLGSDFDLYTNANSEDISKLMMRRFCAQIAPRSWGDRLAGKWNFLIPGLPEAVEIHMGRLGQTGEQVAIASRLAKRTRLVLIGDHAFRVPAASDRLLLSTLQRMYRHFYFRLCDIVDTAALSEAGGIDYKDLLSSASSAGIWEGVATYLAIVSDYVTQFRGSGLDLPQFVIASARFGSDEVYYGRGFLRVPIMPQSAKLYMSQLAGLLRKRELHNGARLSLLPWLATAAVVGQKITGSDKGIW
jgi:Flp pilus assembly pilin Flp